MKSKLAESVQLLESVIGSFSTPVSEKKEDTFAALWDMHTSSSEDASIADLLSGKGVKDRSTSFLQARSILVSDSLYKEITDLQSTLDQEINESCFYEPLKRIKRAALTELASKCGEKKLLKEAIAEVKNKYPDALDGFFSQRTATLMDKLEKYDPKQKLSYEQIKKIEALIEILGKEINSCWPYPNKDLKQIKKNALQQLIRNCTAMEIKDAIAEACSLPGVTDGCTSRVASLLDELACETLQATASFS